MLNGIRGVLLVADQSGERVIVGEKCEIEGGEYDVLQRQICLVWVCKDL